MNERDEIRVEIQSQSSFCLELMRRLDRDIQNAEDAPEWKNGTLDFSSTKRWDIVRLRRELMELSKMLGE